MTTSEVGDVEAGETAEWVRGFPSGPYYHGMENDFEVYFSPGGWVWHRPKTTEREALAAKTEEGKS